MFLNLKKYRKHLNLLIVLLCLVNISFAANTSVSFRHLAMEDGLTDNTIKAILQDSYGFIWFGTANGLNRYDGNNFVSYNQLCCDSLNNLDGEITNIKEDVNKYLWISTAYGVVVLDPQKNEIIKNIELPPSAGIRRVGELYIDSHNLVWLSTQKGLFVYNAVDDNFVLNKQTATVKGVKISGIVEDKLGNVFISSANGLYFFDREKESIRLFPLLDEDKKENISEITCVYVDNKNHLWIGTALNGAIEYDPVLKESSFYTTTSQRYAISNNYVGAIVEDANGRIWIGTRGSGISIIDKLLKQVIVAKHDEKNKRSLCWNVILALYCDNSGGIWVGSYGAGIDYWHPSMYKFGSIQYSTETQNGLSVESVTDLIGDPEGNIWVSGFGTHTLNVIDKSTKESRPITNAFNPGIFIRSLCLDKNNPDKIIWLGTEGNDPQLMKYNYKTGIVERSYNLFNTTTRISCIYDDGSGGIWVGSGKGLVFLNKNNGQFKVYQDVPDERNSLSNNRITCIEADDKGDIWIGTLNGLNKLVLKDDSVFRFYHQALDSTTIGHNVIQSLRLDSDNTLWVGTYRGLNKYDPESNSFVRYNHLSEQFAQEVILAIEEDVNHNLWVSTTKGLTCFNQQSGRIKNYDVQDGILASNLIPNVSYKGKNGQLYFGGVKGITVFDPLKMPFNTHSPQVVVTDLEIFNEQVKVNEVKKGKNYLSKEIYCTDTLHLSFKESVISFRFATLSYVLPARNKYSYRLEGFDEDWHNMGNRNFVTYTNLYPGTYVLKVKGANNDGVWSEKETRMVLIVSPPYYATWWFVSLVFLLLVFGIIGGYYIRLRFIKKQKRALEILVRERTRDLQESTMLLEEKSEEILVQKELLEEQNQEMMAQNEELELHRNSLTQLVEERTKELVTAKEKAEESDRLKSVFLANMSHEIRTPMNAIVGFSELLEEDSVTKEEQRQYLSMIYSNSLSLLNLINDLLDFSKIEANQLQLYARAYDVDALVDEVSATAQSLKNQLGKEALVIKISKPLNSAQSLFIVDCNRLRQVLNNLLSNAIKFSFKGAIEISYQQDEKNLYFSVEDQGIGIDKSMHEVIFNRFTRVTSDISKPILGNGLGLAIVKSLVELMGGKITVESELNKGAKFSFYIPRVDA